MSFLSKLFGGNKTAEPKPVDYKGFDIFPDVQAEGNKYRLAARIEKTVDGTRKSCPVIRADVFDNLEQAESASIAKAKQVIDEQGDGLLG